MFSFLQPDLYSPSLLDIDLQLLKAKKIKGILCDMDNTLISWEKEEILPPIVEWFQEIKEMDFTLCLVSNGLEKRVKAISLVLDIPYVARAVKPRKGPFQKASQILNLHPKEIAVIGDQIFTDILGGNRMGMFTILVDPMSKKELPNTRVIRYLERIIFPRSCL